MPGGHWKVSIAKGVVFYQKNRPLQDFGMLFIVMDPQTENAHW